MANPIRITIRGTDDRGNDAPRVEDLLAQVGDFIFVLREVEGALSEGKEKELVWRVTDATKSSPLTIEVTPCPRLHAANIDDRAQRVVSATAKGFKELSETGAIPIYFSDQVVDRAKRLYSRITNGLASTIVDFSEYASAPRLEVTPRVAEQSVAHVQSAREAAQIPHRELGSLEGFIAKVELDRHARPLIWLRSRLDGQTVKCVSSVEGLDRIGHFEVAKVIRGLRVRVHGILTYKDLQQISKIDVEGVHVFEADEHLPEPSSIVSPGFTGGIEANAFLEALRDDG